MNIDWNLYKVFYIVAKYKSMTKASEILFVSQPAISKSIKTLEEQIGVSLFNRSSRGLNLTEEGNVLYNRISPAFLSIQNAEDELSNFNELNVGEIKIGISTVLTKCLLLDTIYKFKTQYPNVKIKIINGLTNELVDKLTKGELDFIIYSESDIEEKGIESKLLLELNYCFFYNPIFYSIDVKNVDDLTKYPLILQSKNSNTRKFLDYCTKEKLEADVEVISQELICNLVNTGVGIGFAYEKIVDINNLNAEKIFLDNIPATKVYFAKNKSTKLSCASKTFLKNIK